MTTFPPQLLKICSGVIGLFWILSCGQKEHDAPVGTEDAVPKPNESVATKSALNISTAEQTNVLRPELDSNEITGKMLLGQLGAVLPDGTQKRLNKIGDLSEMRGAALEPQGKVYALNIRPYGGLVVHLGEDDALIAFGFASNAAYPLAAEEQQILSEFEFAGEPEVTVLDEKFDPIKMRFKSYASKTSPEKRAVMYSRGSSRTLVFYDSKRVQMSKLLPASPDTMDPAMLKQLKLLVEPAK